MIFLLKFISEAKSILKLLATSILVKVLLYDICLIYRTLPVTTIKLLQMESMEGTDPFCVWATLVAGLSTGIGVPLHLSPKEPIPTHPWRSVFSRSDDLHLFVEIFRRQESFIDSCGLQRNSLYPYRLFRGCYDQFDRQIHSISRESA